MDLSLSPESSHDAAVHSGVDLIEIERVRDVLGRHGDRFLNRIYTTREQDYCGDRLQELAARFAAKEAVMKALGTGVRGVGWREIEVLANARGKPIVLLHGRARTRANRLGFRRVEISMTHERSMACAFAVAISEPRMTVSPQ
ncbi:MAG: holo-[acyl-carrier protein] synthase [Chloroflexi bacterium]|jgi:holo-[acyl-carrier protein] synthase|nr:MAG: holo-[acyl-carrier protein] synthase [Chloroflexota bacterium]